jgi:hypothetical protein
MKRHLIILATAAAAFASAAPGLAAPLDRKDVAADPALLFHLDCDALRNSAVGQSILNGPEVQDKLAALGALIDFDLRKQLHGLTVYTTMGHPKDGALILYADFDPNRLITLAKGAENFQCVTNGAHVIYSWVDEKKKGRGGAPPRVYGALLGHRVVFGQEQSHLAAALDVIEGSAPNFSGNKALPDPAAGESPLIQGIILKFDFDSPDPNAAIFKMSKSARLQLSEMGSNLAVAVHFEAANEETATQIGAIAQGVVALLKLQQADANALKLANAIVVKQDGPTVGLTLSLPSSEVIDMIKDGQAKAAQRRAPRASPPPENSTN